MPDTRSALQKSLAPQAGFAAATGKTATASANTAVTLTLAAATGKRHAISRIVATYSGAPTGGRLSIESPSSTVVFDTDLAGTGLQQIEFNPPLVFAENTAVLVKLAAGGSGVVGKVNVHTGQMTLTPLS